MSVWRIFWTAVVFALPPALAAANSGIIQITSVRAWSHPDSTRIIIQTTGPFEFRSDRANSPDRLFVDVLHARPWISGRRFATREIGDKLIRRVRVAETSPGTSRIVFDLVYSADFRISRLDAPDRLVIEFRPSGSHAASIQRRPFVYPPVIYANRRRPQISMPGLPPALTANMFRAPAWPIFLSFGDPVVEARTTRNQPGNQSSAALASENASRSLTRALGLKVNRIVIDAGHGGHDDGTIGPHGVLEKDVVLDVALRLAKLVQDRMGAEVVLTRSDDTFIPLHERTAIANDHKADLFLSIHANSSPAPEVAGTETFFLNFTNSPDALNVAARENAGADKTVGELKDLIQTITLNDKIEESHTFADDVQNAIQAQAARSNAAAHNRGVKRAPFVVLIGASMPSVLAEIGFLSNARDESNLGKPEYRQKVAEALYKGLAQYSQSLSHFEPSRQIAAGLN
jgi:N-acetylmuramoyl-L-alanine amidase